MSVAAVRKIQQQMRRLGAPSPDEVRERRRRARLARARPSGLPGDGSFRAFVEHVNPGLLQYEHVPRLLGVGQRVADGELTRVVVCMPPRYFKSETFSRLLSAYYLLRHPTRHVGLASYGAELAWSLSEEARNYYEAAGGQLRRETSAKKRWRTTEGGEMWAAGTGGPMIGFGYSLGIVDDPIDPIKAKSKTYQRQFEQWWPSKFLSRQNPATETVNGAELDVPAAIVVVMQRLVPRDPVDFLLRREVGEQTEAAPERWHLVVCDEVKSSAPLWRAGKKDSAGAVTREAGPMNLPATCTLEPDDRAEGEVLSPSLFGPDRVAKMQASAGSAVRDAQRQQRPTTASGDFWRADWFGEYDELPADAQAGGKDWDTAYTKDEGNSASAYVETYSDAAGNVYVHDCAFEWYEFPELVAWMRRVRGPHYVEAKATGKSAAQTLRSERLPVSEVAVEGGDKLARAQSVQTVVSGLRDDAGELLSIDGATQRGRVLVRRSVRARLLEDERQGLLSVTSETLADGGPDLDLNDAFVQALVRHTRRAPDAAAHNVNI